MRAVLQVIADFTGLNIITSDTVTGSLTLRLKDIPWDQALDIIMQTKGLDMRKNGNVVLIAPREELAVKEKQQLESQAQISELEPLQTETFQLNYVKASDILTIIASQPGAGGAGLDAGRFLSKRGSAFVDPRTNILFVSDTASRLEEVRRDHPPARHAGAPGPDRGAHRHRRRQRSAARSACGSAADRGDAVRTTGTHRELRQPGSRS